MFDRAIKIIPNYAYAWYYKGVALDRLGRQTDTKNTTIKQNNPAIVLAKLSSLYRLVSKVIIE